MTRLDRVDAGADLVDVGSGGWRRVGVRTAWVHRRWRALLFATGASGIGDWLYATAFVVWLFDRTGSAWWLGVAAAARALVLTICGPFGGVVAARWGRRELLVALDVSRALVIAVLAIGVAGGAPAAVGLALSCVVSVLTVPYRPALAAATPHVVPETALAAANGAEAVAGRVAMAAGPAVAAALIAFGSTVTALAVNAATFAVAAALVWSCGDLGGAPLDDDRSGGRSRVRSTADRAGAWRAVVAIPGLLVLHALIGLTMLAFGAEAVLHVLVAGDGLGRPIALVGVLTAAMGVGGLLGASYAGRVAASRDTGPWLVACAVVQGLALVVVGFVSSTPIAIAVLLVEGAGVVVFEVLAVTTLRRVAGAGLTQLHGLQGSFCSSALLVGALSAPLLVGLGGLELAGTVGGGAVVVFGVVSAPALRRVGRATTAARSMASIADELGRVGLFDGADRPCLEAIAGVATAEPIDVGSVVVEEGHAADAVFVIRRGVLSARSARTGTVRLMGPGDWFGELGVVGRRPSTASVVAEHRAELWRIPGDAVLAVLGADAGRPLPDPALPGIAGRLTFNSEIAGRLTTGELP